MTVSPISFGNNTADTTATNWGWPSNTESPKIHEVDASADPATVGKTASTFAKRVQGPQNAPTLSSVSQDNAMYQADVSPSAKPDTGTPQTGQQTMSALAAQYVNNATRIEGKKVALVSVAEESMNLPD